MYLMGIIVIRVIDNLNDVIRIIGLSDIKELMVLLVKILFDH
jgi:hypothetical protein